MDLSSPIPFSVVAATIVIIALITLLGAWLVKARKH